MVRKIKNKLTLLLTLLCAICMSLGLCFAFGMQNVNKAMADSTNTTGEITGVSIKRFTVGETSYAYICFESSMFDDVSAGGVETSFDKATLKSKIKIFSSPTDTGGVAINTEESTTPIIGDWWGYQIDGLPNSYKSDGLVMFYNNANSWWNGNQIYKLTIPAGTAFPCRNGNTFTTTAQSTFINADWQEITWSGNVDYDDFRTEVKTEITGMKMIRYDSHACVVLECPAFDGLSGTVPETDFTAEQKTATNKQLLVSNNASAEKATTAPDCFGEWWCYNTDGGSYSADGLMIFFNSTSTWWNGYNICKVTIPAGTEFPCGNGKTFVTTREVTFTNHDFKGEDGSTYVWTSAETLDNFTRNTYADITGVQIKRTLHNGSDNAYIVFDSPAFYGLSGDVTMYDASDANKVYGFDSATDTLDKIVVTNNKAQAKTNIEISNFIGSGWWSYNVATWDAPAMYGNGLMMFYMNTTNNSWWNGKNIQRITIPAGTVFPCGYGDTFTTTKDVTFINGDWVSDGEQWTSANLAFNNWYEGNVGASANEPTFDLSLENASVKNVSGVGTYSVDDKVAYAFFNGNTSLTNNAEIIFAKSGTDTVSETKTYISQSATSFSFSYNMLNDCANYIASDTDYKFRLYILRTDGGLTPCEVTPIADGKWHDITIELPTSELDKFCGFIIKMGGLDGRIYIADVKTTDEDKILSRSLSIDTDFTLNLKAYVKDDSSTDMTFTIDSFDYIETVKGTAVENYDNVYAYSFSGISAAALGAECKITVGTAEKTTSVGEYLKELFDEGDTELKALVVDIIAYAKAAEDYIEKTTSFTAINGTTPSSSTPSSYGATVTTTTTDDIGFTSANLMYTNAVKLVFSFTAPSLDGITVTMQKGSSLETTIEIKSIGNNKYRVMTGDIAAYEYDTTFTVKIKKDGTDVQTLTYSVSDEVYYWQNVKSGDDAIISSNKALTLALYNYGKSVETYKKKDDSDTTSVTKTTASTNAYKATINSVVSTDALGRSFGEASVAESDKDVGMFYFIWHGNHTSEIYNIEELKKNNSSELWDVSSTTYPTGSYYYWAEPLYGYYRSDDPWVVMRHLELFTMSGIDYLALDLTNVSLYETECYVLFNTIVALQQQGWEVPKITVLITGSDYSETHLTRISSFYNKFYKDSKYDGIWYRSETDDKPIICIDMEQYYEKLNNEIKNFYHFRNIVWPFDESGSTSYEDTSWLDFEYPQRLYGSKIMSVSVAQQVSGSFGLSVNPSTKTLYYNNNRGRGYDYTTNTNSEENILSGTNFEAQWSNALNQSDCEEVFITGWNEWVAEKRAQSNLPHYVDVENAEDIASFCDNCDYEFSRDIEMMKGGYGDNYYLQTVRNTRSFKGDGSDYAYYGANATQDLNAETWENVRTYLDFSGDAMARDAYNTNNSAKYVNNTNRNDIVKIEICNDSKYLYIRVITKDDIVIDSSVENNLNVLISVSGSDGAKWNGYSYVLNRKLTSLTQTSTTLQRIAADGQYVFSDVADCEMVINGNTFSAKIALTDLAIANAYDFTIDFKVADGISDPSDIMNYYIDGDSAPIGRLNYRYNSFTK